MQTLDPPRRLTMEETKHIALAVILTGAPLERFMPKASCGGSFWSIHWERQIRLTLESMERASARST